MGLINYIIRRLFILIPVMIGVLALTFVLTRLMPGDPVFALLPHNPSMQAYEAKKHELGLDLPLWIQFFKYFGDLFTGNWGVSVAIQKDYPVWALISQDFPRTLDIAVFSTIFASIIGIKAGKISAVHRNKPQDTFYRGLALMGVAIPVFWLGMVLQYGVAYKLPIFPAEGYRDSILDDPTPITNFRIIDFLLLGRFDLLGDYLLHLVLPVFCLTFITLASITRQTRSSMLEVLQQDYIRTARAKGCEEKVVINTHALKNALIPTVTVIGMNFATLLGGAVLTEYTFNLNGMGVLLMRAIQLTDYWVISATIFVITILFVIVNLITDVIYGIIDPRIRYQ